MTEWSCSREPSHFCLNVLLRMWTKHRPCEGRRRGGAEGCLPKVCIPTPHSCPTPSTILFKSTYPSQSQTQKEIWKGKKKRKAFGLVWAAWAIIEMSSWTLNLNGPVCPLVFRPIESNPEILGVILAWGGGGTGAQLQGVKNKPLSVNAGLFPPAGQQSERRLAGWLVS